mgnify:CR=1 FL=1
MPRERSRASIAPVRAWTPFLPLLVGLALAASCRPNVPEAPSAALACPVPHLALQPDLAAPGTTLILGELHGTREVPAFVASLVCQVSSSTATVLALEVPHTEQARIDAFLASSGDANARAALLRGDFWDFPMQDGRRSEAMVQLLEAVRRLREQGAPLVVIAFDSDAPPDVRDAEMAQRLASARREHSQALFVVVTGGVHASRLPDEAFIPMAVRFAELATPHRIVSLALQHSGGHAWVCTDRCGPHDAEGAPDPGPPRIELFEETTRGFDGTFRVGRITASAPAVAAATP